MKTQAARHFPRQENQKYEDSLLAIAAHELKNPLTTIKAMTHFLVGCIQKGGQNCLRLVNIGTITRELERMNSLIDTMAQSQGVDSFMAHSKLSEVNISTLIHEVIESQSLKANTHKILLIVPVNLRVRADRDRIKQVVINLLSNAIKYSPQRSTVSVKLQRHKGSVVISVKDQGKGIPKENMIAIFDKDYRVPNQKEKGQGLGLHIVKEIIRNHQGKIWVTSRMNKGSTFYFTLPVAGN